MHFLTEAKQNKSKTFAVDIGRKMRLKNAFPEAFTWNNRILCVQTRHQPNKQIRLTKNFTTYNWLKIRTGQIEAEVPH